MGNLWKNTKDNNEPEQTLLLTFQELLLLLQSVGVEQIEGIRMDEEPVSDEEVVMLLNGLVQKGLLTAGDSSFQMEAGLERMIRCMGWPEYAWPAETEYGTVYCYEHGEDVLITRLSAVRRHTIEMTICKKDSVK